VDQSAERLARGGRKLATALPANALLLRADVTDLWALMREAGWQLSHHYLLYPNPWPKAEHLQRRWSGHPRLPDLLALGGRLELRTNWETYAREFARALALAGHSAEVAPLAVVPEEALTPFERKYAASGHGLWRLTARLAAQAGKTPVER
jgi:tRNA (guanine-N7-)-methyltransferase